MPKIPSIFVALLTLICCQSEEFIVKESLLCEIASSAEITYHIILIAGQSNTYSGNGLDSTLDIPNPQIKQLGRVNENNYKLIEAKEPLEHHIPEEGKIGFALTFAKDYLAGFLSAEDTVILVPCGLGKTGFINNKWNPGDSLYKDAVNRIDFLLKSIPNSKLEAILWSQGEVDIENPNYQYQLDTLIATMRKEFNSPSTPFILGGMVPFWVKQLQKRQKIQNIISETPYRICNTGYANPEIPFTIEKSDNTLDDRHYNAQGQRELAKRYMNEYSRIITSN